MTAHTVTRPYLLRVRRFYTQETRHKTHSCLINLNDISLMYPNVVGILSDERIDGTFITFNNGYSITVADDFETIASHYESGRNR